MQYQIVKDTGANIKCKPIAKRVDRVLANYYEGYLVYPTARKAYFSDPEE